MDKLGLRSDIDLALHLPLRYEDETRLVPLAALREGMQAQVEAVVADSRIETRPRRQLIVRLRDGGAELLLRFLHFYPSQQKSLASGARLRVRGEVRGGFFGLEMVHPAFRIVAEGSALPSALTPVYPSSAQLPQAYLRKAIVSALVRAPLHELLPAALLPPGLPSLREALQFLHHPPPDADLATLGDHRHPAWQRLKFEELLAQQLSQAQARRERAQLRAPALHGRAGATLHQQLSKALPFSLTAAQQRVGAEIAADLGRAQPMHRLLQGDVGSGKTVVAALAAARAIDAGWQCALMAPTEILAEQHFRKLVHWLEPLGVGVAWLTGSRKGKARTQMVERVASGQAALVVGTHAVIQDDVHFARLGLAIIDEQHRFGVQQRLALRRKLVEHAGLTPARGRGGEGPGVNASHEDGDRAVLEPHLLMMTATPIPRTLAMTYFADLELSTIDELPPGRTPVLTKVFAEARRGEVVARVRDELSQGRQVYWVCPLIEEAAADLAGQAAGAQAGSTRGGPRRAGHGHDAAQELRNVTQTHAELSAALPGCTVGLLHGRMKPADKAAVMAAFVAGSLQVLVATTVIEVGVDVPNASLMVVEHAERFGLSQLHQLRGRVGRGAAASVCVLLYSPPLSDTGKARLKALLDTQDGFEIARRDLEIRGPGEFMGARQSGDALLRFADLAEDDALLQHARRVAPLLLDQHAEAARLHAQRWLGAGAEFLKA
jgi:ATP-dependent DNA helicase RecG